MAGQAQYEELIRQFSAFGAVRRELGRILPSDCPSGSAAVLTLLDRHGDMRISKLAEFLAVDMSVTSRHVAHAADRGWIERSPIRPTSAHASCASHRRAGTGWTSCRDGPLRCSPSG